MKPLWETIKSPGLILNSSIAKANIKAMATKAKENGLRFRPHFKTHQSAAVGEWFRAEGVDAITVSSVEMAVYFANHGWKDITIAFPANLREIERINQLATKIELGILISSPELPALLDAGLDSNVNAWIEVDIGDRRSGIDWEDSAKITEDFLQIQDSKHLKFKGLLGHAGHSYRSKGIAEIQAVHAASTTKLKAAKQALQKVFSGQILLSTGDTPTCKRGSNWQGIDEIRPGNFVFHDVQQAQIGSCDLEEIAVMLAAPVVAIYPERNELIFHGGGVFLAKDFILNDQGMPLFGLPAVMNEDGWGKAIEGGWVRSISQEHGVAVLPNEILSKIKPGDLIGILPVHSCMCADLMGKYHVRGKDGQVEILEMMKTWP